MKPRVSEKDLEINDLIALFLTVTKLRSRSCACQEQRIPWKERNNEETRERLSLTCDERFEKKN